MRIDGGCHCGAVRFEADVLPETLGMCHCTDCQNLTGSAFRVRVMAKAESFALTGAVTRYIKTADSGTKRAHAFCPVCGTPIYAAALENPQTYSLRLGAIRQRHHLGPPRQQIWCRSALAWVDDMATIPKSA